MDIVYLRDLRVDTVIGIYDWEREIKQTITLDLDMAWDIQRAAADDDIEFALNYKAVSDRLVDYLSTRHSLLIETLAEEIAAIVRNEFDVPWVKVRVGKPGAVKAAADVGIIIERGVKPI